MGAYFYLLCHTTHYTLLIWWLLQIDLILMHMTHFDFLTSAVMGQFVPCPHQSRKRSKPCHTCESSGDRNGVADDCSFYVNKSFPTLVLAFRPSFPFNYAGTVHCCGANNSSSTIHLLIPSIWPYRWQIFFNGISHITFKYVLPSCGTRVSVRPALPSAVMNYLSGIQVSLLHLLSRSAESFIAVHVFPAKALMESAVVRRHAMASYFSL